jgi:hypothetical protein
VIAGVGRFFANPGQVSRGFQIEEWLAERFGGGLPRTFPVIDRLSAAGEAVSVKSLDLAAKTYQNAGRLLNVLTGYIDRLAGFSGGALGRTVVEKGDIITKTLEVVVPPNPTPQQVDAFVRAAQRATEAGVTLRVIIAR